MRRNERPTERRARAAREVAIGRALVGDDVAPDVIEAEAASLRTYLRSQGLSGIAVRAAEAGRLRLPATVLEDVRSDWLDERRWTTTLDLEARRIGALAARSAGALSPPILLKGPCVARRYADPSLRPYCDIDILVPPAEFSRWFDPLRELGYVGPGPWFERLAPRLSPEVTFYRAGGEAGRRLYCDLHQALDMERRTRRFDYDVLVSHCEPSRIPGLLEPSHAALIVVLCLHLVHHDPARRRLVWFRDLLEVGEASQVSQARDIAARHGVAWAVELALAKVEACVGKQHWNAVPPRRHPFGEVYAKELGRGYVQRQVAHLRELGASESVRYLLSRFDPRRFVDETERFSWKSVLMWSRRQTLNAVGSADPAGGRLANLPASLTRCRFPQCLVRP